MHTVARLDAQGCAQAAGVMGGVLVVAKALLGDGVLDALVLSAAAAALTKPAPETFDRRAARELMDARLKAEGRRPPTRAEQQKPIGEQLLGKVLLSAGKVTRTAPRRARTDGSSRRAPPDVDRSIERSIRSFEAEQG